jgi:hypothetical protein
MEACLKIGRLTITARRWPWQKTGNRQNPDETYGWLPHRNGRGPTALLNMGGARFGGGWRYKLRIDIGSSTVLLNLLFGYVTISLTAKTNGSA